MDPNAQKGSGDGKGSDANDSSTTDQAGKGAGGAGDSSQQGNGKTTTSTDGKGAKASDASTSTELEIKFPEGAKTFEERVGKFKSLAKEHGFTSKQAQALVDFNLAAIKEDADKSAREWEQQKKTWGEQLKADKDFGGANYDKNLDFANKAIRQFGGDQAVARFNDTGIAFDPVFVKFMAAVGKAIADDKIDVGDAKGSDATGREAELRAMFPNSYEQMVQPPA